MYVSTAGADSKMLDGDKLTRRTDLLHVRMLRWLGWAGRARARGRARKIKSQRHGKPIGEARLLSETEL